MSADPRIETIRQAIDNMQRYDDPDVRSVIARVGWAALDSLAADLARIRTCPYCAAGFELPDGWRADCCPGCKRAELAEARHAQTVEALEQIRDSPVGRTTNVGDIARAALAADTDSQQETRQA